MPTSRQATAVSVLAALLGVMLTVLLAGCESADNSGNGPATTGTTPSANASPRPSGSTLEGKFSYDTIDDYVNAVIPLMTQWTGATWPQMSQPRVRYVPNGASGPEDCVDQNGQAATYTAQSYEYCGADNTIYLGQNSLWGFYTRTGDAGPAVALAHEYGHHVQQQAGVPSPSTPKESINHENQADCIAGAWTRYADEQGWLEYPDDLKDIEQLFPLIGSGEGPERDHGTTAERVKSFQLGQSNGIAACNSFYPQTPLTSNR
ncbi:MAG TPA: neutral zinc metallopeptidase [Micromonosporaceae bacterium]